ncbi:MAG: DUF1810 domain-containing protein [Clostridia bacterium]|nr:DUF1810 domain-containing protein [Clostridia bacterium]
MIDGINSALSDDISRFLAPQEQDYPTALGEIRRGRKTSHWIWYIFPQLRGLGSSEYAWFFGINGLAEAKQYAAHPLLYPRLIEITRALLAVPETRIDRIVGYPDDRKVRSCMTLFEAVCPHEPLFGQVLDKYYAGRRDGKTLEMIEK